jgi:ATP-dependent Clp protease protease subunit
MMGHDSKSLLESLFDYGIDLRARRIYLHWSIEHGEKPGSGTAQQVVRALMQLDKTEGRVELWINTPGGDIADMFGIYDVIRQMSNEVWTIGFGEVCSAGVLLLVSGDKRYSTPNCWFMSHNPWAGSDSDSLPTLETQIAAFRRQWNRWAKLMAHHTAHSAEWWLEVHNKKRELWMSAQEMIQRQHRIVDGLWRSED